MKESDMVNDRDNPSCCWLCRQVQLRAFVRRTMRQTRDTGGRLHSPVGAAWHHMNALLVTH